VFGVVSASAVVTCIRTETRSAPKRDETYELYVQA
jgi:hypothetical protein